MATLFGTATATFAEIAPLANASDGDEHGWIFGLVFWLALLAVAILLIRGRGWFGSGPRGGAGNGESGRALIERRFAEGKLDADEFRRRREVLDERETGDEQS